MYTKNTPSQKNQEQQALEQIRAIIETLGAASALQNIFSAPSEVPGDPKLTDELRQIHLPEKTVQECNTASPIEEFNIQTPPLF